MKILKNNYNNISNIEVKRPSNYPRRMLCQYCGSELEYDKSDLRMGEYGCMYVDCPLCGYDNMLEDNEYSITLTADNIQFPTHFHHTCVENGAIDCCDNDHVKEYIKKAIEYFRENKDEFSWFTQCGNFRIDVERWSGDEIYEVIVTKDFYSMEIPFEAKDY